MHACVVRLLWSSSDEESLECFAGLITIVGKDLDHSEAKVHHMYYVYVRSVYFSVCFRCPSPPPPLVFPIGIN